MLPAERATLDRESHHGQAAHQDAVAEVLDELAAGGGLRGRGAAGEDGDGVGLADVRLGSPVAIADVLFSGTEVADTRRSSIDEQMQ